MEQAGRLRGATLQGPLCARDGPRLKPLPGLSDCWGHVGPRGRLRKAHTHTGIFAQAHTHTHTYRALNHTLTNTRKAAPIGARVQLSRCNILTPKRGRCGRGGAGLCLRLTHLRAMHVFVVERALPRALEGTERGRCHGAASGPSPKGDGEARRGPARPLTSAWEQPLRLPSLLGKAAVRHGGAGPRSPWRRGRVAACGVAVTRQHGVL